MVAFTPASDVWTLGYDQFDDICWRHKKTQELYYIPPGQPLVLPPRSLANVFRPNRPFTPGATVRAEAFPLQGFGESVPFNNNFALKVPETARVRPAFFVGCAQPRLPPPMSMTNNAKQWLPPMSLENAPPRNFPSELFPPAATAHAKAFPLQGVGEGEKFDHNSALEVPEAARVRPASIVENTKPHRSPPMSSAKDTKHCLPPKSSANAPRSNISNDAPFTPASTMQAEASLLRGDGEGEKFDNNSALKVPEATRVWPASIVEDTKPRRSPPVSRVEENTKHGLAPKSVANAPRSNISNDDPFNPTVTAQAEAFSLQGAGEGEQFDNNSSLEVTEITRVRLSSIVEDSKPHPSPPVSRANDTKQWLARESSKNAPRSNISNDTPFTPDATVGAESSLLRGAGEGEQFDNNSALKVTEITRVRPASIVKDTEPHPSPPVSRANDTKRGLGPKSSANSPRSNISNDTPFTPDATVGAESSLLQGAGEGEQFDNNSTLKVTEITRVRPASIVKDTKPHPSPPVSRANGTKQWLAPESSKNAPRSNISNDASFIPDATVGAEASLLRGAGEGEQFDNNSALKIPEATRVRPSSIVEDTKPHPSLCVSRADDAKHGLTPKSSANAPRSNILNDAPFSPAARVGAEASIFRGDDEGEQFDNYSSLEVPEATSVRSAPILGIKPRLSSPVWRAEEAKQWSRKRDSRGKEYYFNIVTGESTSKKPDCLKKYTCRP